MMSAMQKYSPEPKDRVAFVEDGKIVKGRVAEVLAPHVIRVTRTKGDEGKVLELDQVMPLYRYAPMMIAQHVEAAGEQGMMVVTMLVPVALCAGVPEKK
jgi:hypothetical protein